MWNDVISRSDFSISNLAANDYRLNMEPGVYEAVLEMKAQAGRKILRVFFTFEDGRKIIAPSYPWQRYLGFYEIPLGSRVRLTYTKTSHGTFLTKAELIDEHN